MNRIIFVFCISFLYCGCNYGTTNAVIEPVILITDSSLGAVQGVVIRDGLIYAYGDLKFSGRNVGVIREYTPDLQFTGRMVKLTRNNVSIIPHPTGLTWDPHWGTFIGNTVRRKGEILRIDWDRAWRDLNLDNAVLDIIDDDAASNGSRPVFVMIGKEQFIASADYMGFSPELRLYNISSMLKAGNTSSDGVVIHTIKCSQNTQNLYWNSEKGHLTFVQNIWPFMWPYRGFHLETIKLSDAIAAGSASDPSAIVSSMYFNDKEELEGWYPVNESLSIFAVNRKVQNLFTAKIKLLQ
jgi:hypothetical protein